MKTITVSIVNVTSYTGVELLRLLSAHPRFSVASVTARSAAGKRLCERYRERIKGAALVANPGCYATAAILGLAPALSMGLITPDIIIDAKSGVSGSGRSLTLGTHYVEANEDVSAYSLSGHRHLPEITQELEGAALAGGHPLRITFIAHLLTMTRCNLATCSADLNHDAL